MESIKQKILGVLVELGVSYCDEIGEDTSLTEYIVDSLSFMSFVIGVEETFQIELPDEYLTFEAIQSLNGFVGLLEVLLENNEKNQIFID